MQTLGPILMKGLLALGLIMGLLGCSGSDFAGSNARKSLKLGNGDVDGVDAGDVDGVDAGDVDGVDSGDVDGGDSGDVDGVDGVDGYDGSADGEDGSIDADGDSGSTDADGDDVGLDGGEFNAKLRDPLTVKTTAVDEDMEIFVQYKKKDGSFSAERSVKFKDGENATKTIEGVCRKKDNGTGELVLKMRVKNLEGDGPDLTSAGESVRKTGGAGSMVKISGDLDGCGDLFSSVCIEPEKDNTWEMSCPKFNLKVEGF